ncbi:initiation factor 2 subunit family, putative [Plasmodium relictum]|uniref:Translation initiation factor eIF2B subunit delta n=1 Tax=Plasmodium relictum TaxID=85471 RepID=A0A1J1H456_PLARL|nr:initiation factor 2 subunit family, putative [Plasmodium relictum]CRG99692.1 initiation factor 2 subunit family, putative [Plasmodium relictum]
MDDKYHLTFVKRKKKKVNGKISKEKCKKNFVKNEKYLRVSTLNKNISKKTFLYTLFKSFIKPYNERNTAFYSILCIINNIYKCRYFFKHRCLICKPFHDKRVSTKDDNAYSSDGDDSFPYNIYYNIKKMNLLESNKIKNNNSNNNNNDKSGINNKANTKSISSYLSAKSMQQNSEQISEPEEKMEEKEKEKEKKRVAREENKKSGREKEEREGIEEESKTILSESLKSNIVCNKTRLSSNSKHNISIINETQVSTLTMHNFVNMKLNLTNANQYHFLSHEKMNYVDIYNFDLFDKINMYDKILLDLNQNEIHPNILRTGIFFNKYCNTTHNHRNVDLLIALKSFIKDYTLPPYEPINKHMKVVIDKEINYIIMCKKHSVSMGEVIRWFKNMISEHIGKSVLEETKEIIINNINNYIRTKIVIPSINISNHISEYIIEDNDVLLIYTFDYVIYLSIVKAKKKGKNFEIILVDSEPYKNSYNIKLYTKLGISVTYTLISGLFYNIKRCTKILLGIDAVIHNSVYGYVGTSIICMLANISNVNVYIICETYKISNKIIIDSFNMNNINNNLDIYDYIYMHHYHHANPHNCASNKKKNIEYGSTFNKNLNNFIHSFCDIKMNNILFNNMHIFNKPTIKYSSELNKVNSLKNSNKSKNTKKDKEPAIDNAIPRNELLRSEINKSYECSIVQFSNSSFHSETKKDQNTNDLFFKNKKKNINKEQKSFFFMKNCKEENNISIIKENFCDIINTNEENNIKKKDRNVSLSNFKEVNSISTKNILKRQINLSHESKSENTSISFSNKQNSQNILNDNKNIKKNKGFFNLWNDKNFIEKNTYSLNFKNHFDVKINNINSQIEQNEDEDEQISCNNVCDSICNSIGNINIKNICTDKHNETNLFSSVFSHINKINSNNDKSFYVANICNDVTPLKYINYIVTEVGVYTSVNKNALNVFIHNNI